jgi:hypothetical protein
VDEAVTDWGAPIHTAIAVAFAGATWYASSQLWPEHLGVAMTVGFFLNFLAWFYREVWQHPGSVRPIVEGTVTYYEWLMPTMAYLLVALHAVRPDI